MVYSGTAKWVDRTLGVKCSGYWAARVRTPSMASGERRLGGGRDGGVVVVEDAVLVGVAGADGGADEEAVVVDGFGDAVGFGTGCSPESGLGSPNCARLRSTLKVLPGFVVHRSLGSLPEVVADAARAFLS